MKKLYIYIGIIIITLIIAIFVGIYLYNMRQDKSEPNNEEKLPIAENLIIEEPKSNIINNTISTTSEEEKISPKAVIILKKEYKDCGHIIKQYKEAKELVNLTKQELEEKYYNWKIEEFTPMRISLIKSEAGNCNEHYILREKDGIIAIYSIDKDGNEILKEETEIVTQYLTDTDLIKIKNGIYVFGEEELNAILEDYE
ncbi:MAG: hypothetical protein HFJ53_05515 [Clostridia bacterium]|jgi:hypothetical protein|nr:hypothetical protein [Clostridia bacterium]